MSLRIAILTPDPAGAWAGSRWGDVLPRLAAPLEAAGAEVRHRPWTEEGDLSGFDLVLPLLAWGYHRDGDWQGRLAALAAEGVRLANGADVLAWNADKSYLGRLAAAGAPVVPTVSVDRVDPASLDAAAARFGTDRLVAKPRISAGAWRTVRWSPGAPLADAPDGPAMIQPYLSAIETTGEVSLVYLGGAFSHAISKRPQPGDFRVQPEYDGIIAAHGPSEDERAAADAVLAAADADLLYARVDLVRDDSGTPLLMEMELVEPDLYLQYHPAAPARFADAMLAAAGTPTLAFAAAP
jgi:hypothetical protein